MHNTDTTPGVLPRYKNIVPDWLHLIARTFTALIVADTYNIAL
ncbi:hypothetical protein DYBT9275_05831 [Dyadobacter sp. CECT 9275]|uniref:Uncharacterized protein n=1 Tax=Dyadobacter helix TaxID=2822344 RepID=A0A916JHK3_9BACT|nr:hypothetical protein [Dyadobacter sp. CECT 9275]CAG5017716.1 hypothetical protein DYBT9275_05831 [Dyadobacter sp. CECT 9275]